LKVIIPRSKGRIVLVGRRDVVFPATFVSPLVEKDPFLWRFGDREKAPHFALTSRSLPA